MKIKKVEIFSYGKFKNFKCDFQNLQVIYGNNESGKTTMINFIKDILFGFERRSTSHPYAPKDKSEMGGRLLIEYDNSDYIVQRVDGKNGGDVTVYDSNENEVPATLLEKFRGPIDRSVFDNLFYFGAPDLKEISNLTTVELEERIRQVGVVGINQWLNLKNKIAKDAGEIYKPRGRKQELNGLLKGYEELEEEVNQAKQKYPEFIDLSQREKELNQELEHINGQVQKLIGEETKLNQDRQSWYIYKEIKNFEQKQLKPLPGYTDQELQKFNQLEAKIDNAKLDLQMRKSGLDKLKNTTKANSSIYQTYLDNRLVVENLNNELEDKFDLSRELRQIEQRQSDLQEQIKIDNIEAGGENSQPFDEKTAQKVNELFKTKNNLDSQRLFEQSRKTAKSPEANKLPLVLMLLGVIISLVSFFVGGIGLPILLIVGLIILGLGIYQKSNDKKANLQNEPEESNFVEKINQIDQQLEEIGTQHSINNVKQENWTGSLQTAIARRDNEVKRNEQLQQQVDLIKKQINDYIVSWIKLGWKLNENENLISNLNKIKQIKLKLQDEISKKQQDQQYLQEQQQQFDQYNENYQNINHELTDFLQQKELNTKAEYLDNYQKQVAIKKQIELYEENKKKLNAEIINRLNQYTDENDLLLRLKTTKRKKEQIELQSSELVKQKTITETKLDGLRKDGTFDNLRQQLANKQTEIIHLTEKWLSLKLTNQWIEKVLNLASHGRFPQVQKLAEKYFNLLTANHYDRIKYDKKITVYTNQKQKFEIKELSRGTMQQLYLSFILALTISFSEEYEIPIVIDDGFVDFDSNRTDAAISLLQEVAKDTQVIYYTANEQILEKINQNNILNLN
ncbi:AAA family ATPase [Fructilactobacillus vespulae]|uniref:ATP-binding protein n=1 Tax=Fructilactobacillus vespulae TaxID=1249630 RepID=UPI0039B59ECF